MERKKDVVKNVYENTAKRFSNYC